jgi:antitoxin component YwqK of YwqJK toxin-antitoxin module
MKKLIIYLFLLFSLTFYAQNTEPTYYDSDWNICQIDKAKYYRIYNSYNKYSKTWNIKTYYKSGTIQWIGSVKNNDPKATDCKSAKCHGIATWFNEYGNRTSERGYLNGTTLIYDNDGIITQRLDFINGELVKKRSFYVHTSKWNNSG